VNSCASQIHIALMGDPTLRMHVVAPPANLISTTNGAAVNLTWTFSSDPVLGYYVYSSPSLNGPFTRLTTTPVAATNYADATSPAGSTYMVRAVKLETSASGSYYNLSQGAFLNSIVLSAGIGPIASSSSTNPISSSNTNIITGPQTNSLTPTGLDVAWVDDGLPAGAISGVDGNDAWNWISSTPTPF